MFEDLSIFLWEYSKYPIREHQYYFYHADALFLTGVYDQSRILYDQAIISIMSKNIIPDLNRLYL